MSNYTDRARSRASTSYEDDGFRDDDSYMSLPREMLIALIVSKEYIERVEQMWRIELLDTKLAQIVSKWCFRFWRKYKRAPGSDIESYLMDRRDGLDHDTAEQIDLMLKSLSNEYHRHEERREHLDVDYLVDRTWQYFRAASHRHYAQEYSTLVERGEFDKAEALAKPQPVFDSNDVQEVVTLSQVERRPVEWLMQDVIPRGYLTLLAGPKNAGKTLFAEWAAARMSRGEKWRIVPGRGHTGDTLLMTVEDAAEDMMGPRIDAAEGDDRRIHVVRGIARRDEDGRPVVDLWDVKNISKMEQWLDRYRRVRLIVIDPVGDFLPDAKRNSSTSAYQHVRRALSPLAQFASRRGIAILLTTHLRKGHEGTALDKIIDSTGFTTIARMVIVMAPHPDDPDHRGVLAVAATNLLRRPWPSFGYRIDSVDVQIGDQLGPEPVLVFEGKSDVTADELLSKPQRPEERLLHQEIQDWLVDVLTHAGGSAPVEQVFEIGKQHDYSRGQIRTAAHHIGIKKPRKEGFNPSRWVYELPKMRSEDMGH